MQVIEDDADFEVWPENVSVVRLFFDLSTQWRCLVGERIVWLGLDYSAVDVVMRRRGIEDSVFIEIQSMEWAALEVLNVGQSVGAEVA